MRTYLLALLCALSGLAVAQRGFNGATFSSSFNSFPSPFSGLNSRPRPGPSTFFRAPSSGFQTRPAPPPPFRGQSQFSSRPAPQPSHFSRPAPEPHFSRPEPEPHFSSGPSFSSRPSGGSGSFMSFNGPSHSMTHDFGGFRGGSFQSEPHNDFRGGSFSSEPQESFRGGSGNAGGNSIGGSSSVGNHDWNGKSYLLTWRDGDSSFSYSGAVSYCRSKGMQIVSLDSSAKSDHFIGELARDNAPYFWAGGRISDDAHTLFWENGKSESISRGRGFWSTEGRSGAQPEKGGECLAILNDVYQDGIRWHDVACHHKKPTICESV